MSAEQLSFEDFFWHLHGQKPFPWQERLAARVCTQGWPQVIALPTGSGKTACVDIAVYAMAYGQPQGPRRVFYVVDRRLVVSEAYARMQRIECRLCEVAELAPVAQALQERAHKGAKRPVLAFELRGGTYLDNSWVRTPLQPLLAACTVDQLGSRLLFRGYGVRDTIAPIHAGLVANDSLILLDEAHASRAFSQTLEAVERYAREREGNCGLPATFRYVEMTATPNRGSDDRFELDDRDRADPELRRRLQASKPVRLIEAKLKRNDAGRLAEQLASVAVQVAEEAGVKRIAVICNRVQTARLTRDHLRKLAKTEPVLVTGRMRPWDRDELYQNKLKGLKSSAKRVEPEQPVFVVATQTLEVGADLDFDVLVTELASLDALLQRFGRLNRMGQCAQARGAVVAAAVHLSEKEADPVYGDRMPKTWKWLNEQAADGCVSMRLGDLRGVLAELSDERRSEMSRSGPDAPILLPAHLDAWVQTSPRPVPEPEVSLFLHGVEPASAEVQLVWRADLLPGEEKHWPNIAAFCPPRALEAFPVRLGTARRWLSGKQPSDAGDADVEGACGEESQDREAAPGNFLLWRNGGASIGDAGDLRPGDTVILPASEDIPEAVAQVPANAVRDLGDWAALRMKRRVTLRWHPDLIATWADGVRVRAKGAARDLDAAQELFAGGE
ncbi:MAG: type I-G CRISPR-associated helicase/endonuclease Cas3g, partial [Terriglobales bacterium]